MDALSSILEITKLSGVVYNKVILNAPWGIEVAEDGHSQFWRLIKGRCLLGLPNGTVTEMKERDLLFIPHGSAHWIADSPASMRIKAADYTKALNAGLPVFKSGGTETVLVGGHFRFEDAPQHPFLRDMPQVICITHFESENQLLLQHIAQLIFNELNIEKQGSKVMLRGLSEMLFIHIMRAYLEQLDAEKGFLSALNDNRISKALKLMQDNPGRNWTMESLAGEVGLSRSAFFNRFKKLVGETPSDYLTNWRIGRAKQILAKTDSNINEVAAGVGYQSEAAFNRIFKAKTGQTPAIFRRKILTGDH